MLPASFKAMRLDVNQACQEVSQVPGGDSSKKICQWQTSDWPRGHSRQGRDDPSRCHVAVAVALSTEGARMERHGLWYVPRCMVLTQVKKNGIN